MFVDRMVVFGVFMLACMGNALAGDVKVIANAAINSASISDSELRSVFLLQRKTLKDGSAVEPVLQKRGPVHDAFCRQFLSRDGEEIRIYYDGIVFTGKGLDAQATQFRRRRGEICGTHARGNWICKQQRQHGWSQGADDGVGEIEKAKITGDASGTRISKGTAAAGHRGNRAVGSDCFPKGSVESVQVVGGNPILAEAAVKSVKQWIYSPSAMTSVIDVSIPFEAHP